eukprot:2510258-Prymnesium_polylepis.1
MQDKTIVASKCDWNIADILDWRAKTALHPAQSRSCWGPPILQKNMRNIVAYGLWPMMRREAVSYKGKKKIGVGLSVRIVFFFFFLLLTRANQCFQRVSAHHAVVASAPPGKKSPAALAAAGTQKFGKNNASDAHIERRNLQNEKNAISGGQAG